MVAKCWKHSDPIVYLRSVITQKITITQYLEIHSTNVKTQKHGNQEKNYGFFFIREPEISSGFGTISGSVKTLE